jgi:hypothetical protein
VAHDVGASLGHGKEKVSDGLLIEAEPAESIAEYPPRTGDAERFSRKHQAEPDT